MHQDLHPVGIPAIAAHLAKDGVGPVLRLLQPGLFLRSHGGAVHGHEVADVEGQQAFAKVVHIRPHVGEGRGLEEVIAGGAAADGKPPAVQFVPQPLRVRGEIARRAELQSLIARLSGLVKEYVVRRFFGGCRPPKSPPRSRERC